jgi:tRNA A-37 threonylcarbamoyl transferase component Bud32
MESALTHIHSKGYVRGDIAQRNFCKKADVVFVVDLESRRGSPVEIDDELDEIDGL